MYSENRSQQFYDTAQSFTDETILFTLGLFIQVQQEQEQTLTPDSMRLKTWVHGLGLFWKQCKELFHTPESKKSVLQQIEYYLNKSPQLDHKLYDVLYIANVLRLIHHYLEHIQERNHTESDQNKAHAVEQLKAARSWLNMYEVTLFEAFASLLTNQEVTEANVQTETDSDPSSVLTEQIETAA